jgi:hypothetical protein
LNQWSNWPPFEAVGFRFANGWAQEYFNVKAHGEKLKIGINKVKRKKPLRSLRLCGEYDFSTSYR